MKDHPRNRLFSIGVGGKRHVTSFIILKCKRCCKFMSKFHNQKYCEKCRKLLAEKRAVTWNKNHKERRKEINRNYEERKKFGIVYR